MNLNKGTAKKTAKFVKPAMKAATASKDEIAKRKEQLKKSYKK